jgi:hypothetical protein
VSDLKPYELLSALLTDSLILVALIGLLVRRHFPSCRVFGVYLAAVLVTDLAMLADAVLWKDSAVFYTRAFYYNKEILLNALKFGVVLELAYRVFGAFPGARATAQFLLVLLLGLTFASVVSASGWFPLAPESLAGVLQPRIVTGTTWLFAIIAALILWYRLPVETMQKAILIGFVPFLIFSYLVLELQKANNWPQQGWVANAESWVYLLLLAYWARTAWQPFREIIPARRPVPAVQGSTG